MIALCGSRLGKTQDYLDRRDGAGQGVDADPDDAHAEPRRRNENVLDSGAAALHPELPGSAVARKLRVATDHDGRGAL